jgi:mono/diheme cytochrome c family protein
MKTFILMLVTLVFATSLISFIQPKPDQWKVPEKYEKMKNPIVSDEASIKAGNMLYTSHCLNCHGAKGTGDGKKAASLSKAPSDFTSAEFQKQTDGALLYKIYFGHKDMPGFKNRIPDNEDVIENSFGKTRSPGDLINYLRTLAKK